MVNVSRLPQHTDRDEGTGAISANTICPPTTTDNITKKILTFMVKYQFRILLENHMADKNTKTNFHYKNPQHRFYHKKYITKNLVVKKTMLTFAPLNRGHNRVQRKIYTR